MKKNLPWIILVGCVLFLLPDLRLPRNNGLFPRNEFGELPVLVGGRLKPFDTVARNSLMIIHGKQTLRKKDQSMSFIEWLTKLIQGKLKKPTSAIEWLMDVMMRPESTKDDDLFVITHSDILGMMGWEKSQKKYFSWSELESHFDEIQRQAKLAETVESQVRSTFQREILKLYQRLELYYRLKNSLWLEGETDPIAEITLFESVIVPGARTFFEKQKGAVFSQENLERWEEFNHRYGLLDQVAYLLPIPPEKGQKAGSWSSIGQNLVEAIKQKPIRSIVKEYAATVSAYRKGSPDEFKEHLSVVREEIDSLFANTFFRARYEFRFNHFAPFYKCMTLYILVFVFISFGWLGFPDFFHRSAYMILVLSFLVHTGGLISRMYLQGRPPVTNLYSSAIFIGWGVVLLGLILEKIYKDGAGGATASVLGFITLLIAHHLSGDGDTMEMLRAVLDTNFWLATHVVAITLGYASTFLAGFLALMYIFRGMFTRSLDKESAQSLMRMVYGIICFATLFSFVGTILGGIWADQSWGRFWGWDPKENGALLIVLWNAIILHSRWGGMIKQKGLMIMAVFGNIVTSFSWFGVNMLGVGLHSYGFIDQAFFWLLTFMVSQLVFMMMGALPNRYWRSFAIKFQ